MLYLEDHAAELMPAAIEQARRIILSGAMGKRAAREPQSAEPQSIGTSVVQNSGANGGPINDRGITQGSARMARHSMLNTLHCGQLVQSGCLARSKAEQRLIANSWRGQSLR
jgi:hypothetical protein